MHVGAFGQRAAHRAGDGRRVGVAHVQQVAEEREQQLDAARVALRARLLAAVRLQVLCKQLHAAAQRRRAKEADGVGPEHGVLAAREAGGRDEPAAAQQTAPGRTHRSWNLLSATTGIVSMTSTLIAESFTELRRAARGRARGVAR